MGEACRIMLETIETADLLAKPDMLIILILYVLPASNGREALLLTADPSAMASGDG